MFKVETIQQAYEATGRTPFEMPEIAGLPESDRQYIKDNFDLTVTIDAINQESNGGKPWKADYTDGTRKYEPYFWVAKSNEHGSGFVFSRTDYVCTYTFTLCGSRFAFHSYEAWNRAMEIPAVIDLFLSVWTRK